jgi:hypothetical protein
MVEERVRLNVLPIVKAYPEPSTTYGSTVCVAGVTIPEGQWVRLYPVRFSELSSGGFSKYQPIEVTAVKSSKDYRPESYRVDEGSISVVRETVNTKNAWAERKRLLAEAPFASLCELQRAQKQDGSSLGMIRVKEVKGFRTVEADEDKFKKSEKKNEYAATADLFNENTLQVESLSFKYLYYFTCMDESCKGHKCSIIDWEAYQLHRKMAQKWGEENAFEKVRQKYVDELCGPDKETYFFMGNMQRHPGSFLVLGVFYPPIMGSPTLFELREGRKADFDTKGHVTQEAEQLSISDDC